MKLCVNAIFGQPNRYYLAGQEIPDEKVPTAFRRYAMTAGEDEKVMESRSAANTTHRRPVKGKKGPRR
jgi:hypothetical protein